jgi:glyoxylase-like metal-dependent hydrolase (beta-lactamase superfamily II)/8-oxo-dGTP pyrophosphatase MutT (NUDIX family)
MSELPEGIEPAPIPEPIDSALGIVVTEREDRCAVLLGRRSRRARFMPGNLVFPGGKLDAEDGPTRPGAFARCASRELLEEAGLELPPDAWHAAGERTTPPLFPVRFRTAFFVAEVPKGTELPKTPPSPDEIESLSFADPREVLAAWESGRALVPPPILPILRLIAASLYRDPAALAAQIGAVNAEESASPRIEFIPGLWVFPVRTRTLPPASCTNVWMPGGRRFVVIDPGSAEADENEKLLAVIARRVAQGDRLLAVVLSHHHRDHVGGVGAIARALSVPVWAHAETFARIGALPPAVATRTLRNGDTLDLEGTAFRVMHTPGHAPGHLAFFDESRRVLLAGDLVSGLSTILVGPNDGDMSAYLDSLRRVAALDPKTVLPSHGPPLPGASLAATIAHRLEREAGILAVLRDGAPRELSAIAIAAYAGTLDAPAFLREMQTRAHLEHLIGRGLVEKTERCYRIPGTSIMS